MDGFIFRCAQQGSGGRGWVAVGGSSVEGPKVSVLGWEGLGVLSRSGSPIAVVNRGWGWFGKGLWSRGSQHRQGDSATAGRVGSAWAGGASGTPGDNGTPGTAAVGPSRDSWCPFLVWREGKSPAWSGQEVRAAVQGLAVV